MKHLLPKPSKLFQVNEIDLVYKNKLPFDDRLCVSNADTAYEAFMSVWNLNKIDLVEQFKVMLLDTAGRCLGVCDIARGGINHCMVDSRLIFAAALKAKATALILAHNHPSGNLTPSDNDLRITKRLVDGGKLLDIRIADHLILGRTDYRSLDQDGLMP